MSNPTDMLKEEKLSPVGRILLKGRDAILEKWKKDVQRDNERAAELSHPILIDTLPTFLDNLAEALSPDYPRANAADETTVAQEHGGERARLSNYQLGDLIREYQLLRETVISYLNSKAKLSEQEFEGIQTSFNVAIRQGATSFALVHSQIREQFVATLTHDLRNPLNSIAMASQLLQKAPELESNSRNLAAKILENTRRMDRMIQDLLDVTYVRAGGRLSLRIAQTNLLEIIHDVVAHMTLSHGKKFVIEGKAEPGCWDAEALRRAIENLASNAIKYGDSNSPVTILLIAEHGRMNIKIHNEGDPIPAEEQEAIFQAYRRIRAHQAGSRGWGIGLPLVRAVAEAHGGSLQLDSAPGRGTTFTIDIPLDSRPFRDSPTTPQ